MLKKFNWGWGIALVYSTFVIAFLGVLVYSTTQKVDLVDEHYYNAELTYQSRMDAINRGAKIDNQMNFQFDKVGRVINFELPFTKSNIQENSLKFYRPSNSKLDKQIKLENVNVEEIGENSKYKIDLAKFENGVWKMQLELKYKDSLYYIEKLIQL